jgi:uncharacterized protein (DUF362 family)
VLVVRSAKALDGQNRPVPAVLARMIQFGLTRLFDEAEAAKAWARVIRPDDKVGLKVNCLGGPALCTHPALADAVAQSLAAAGMAGERILVWDRTDGELERCGFALRKTGAPPRCFGTPGYEEQAVEAGGVRTRLSTLVTRDLTALVNLPVLKTHTLAGFSGALKNELGCVNNARDFHADACRAAADVCALDPIAGKRRLVIGDALRPLYDGGPTDMPRCRWNEGALLFAVDPLAADWVGRSIIEAKRKAVQGGKPWPLRPPAAHLDRAVELALGAASLESVEVIEASV